MELHTGMLRSQNFGEVVSKNGKIKVRTPPHSEVRIEGVCVKRLLFESVSAPPVILDTALCEYIKTCKGFRDMAASSDALVPENPTC